MTTSLNLFIAIFVSMSSLYCVEGYRLLFAKNRLQAAQESFEARMEIHKKFSTIHNRYEDDNKSFFPVNILAIFAMVTYPHPILYVGMMIACVLGEYQRWQSSNLLYTGTITHMSMLLLDAIIIAGSFYFIGAYSQETLKFFPIFIFGILNISQNFLHYAMAVSINRVWSKKDLINQKNEYFNKVI